MFITCWRGEQVAHRARCSARRPARAAAPATRRCARDGARRRAAARCSSRRRAAREAARARSASSKHARIGHERQPVQERQVAAQRSGRAGSRSAPAPATCRARRGPKTNHGATSSRRWLKRTPARWNQRRHEVQRAAERVRDRLGLVVVDEAREIAPARVAAQLDQARAEHDAEDQPAQQPDDARGGGRRGNGRGSSSGQRKIARKPVSSELDLPAVAVPEPGRRGRTTCRAPRGRPGAARWRSRSSTAIESDDARSTRRPAARRSEASSQKRLGTRRKPPPARARRASATRCEEERGPGAGRRAPSSGSTCSARHRNATR